MMANSWRFVVGDRVSCLTEDNEWCLGTVVALNYRRADWDLQSTVPYQVELDLGILIYVPQDTDEACKGVEKAWWEAAFKDQAQAPHDKSSFDWPGPYLVVAPTWVSCAMERGSLHIADAFPPECYDVVEVRVCGNRVRGRVTKPEGWISLRSTDDEKVFAVPTGSAYARCFRNANPKLFVDECADAACWAAGCKTNAAQPSVHLSVERLLNCWNQTQAANVDQKSERGSTALLTCLKHRWLEGAKELLRIAADVNLGDCMGRRPLHCAVDLCHDAVLMLLHAGANPDLQDRNPDLDSGSLSQTFSQPTWHRSPLHYSAEAGHVQITKVLLKAKANPDIPDGERKVPLHLAIEENHTEVVDILLHSKAATDLGNYRIGLNSSPLLDAVYRNDHEMALKLIRARANINLAGKNEMTSLHLAVRAKHVPMAHMLVAEGCDITLCTSGMTAADLATKNGLHELASLLLGGNPSQHARVLQANVVVDSLEELN